MKNFRAHSVFQVKQKLLKNLECKKFIQFSEKFQGTHSFSGQSQICSQILNVKHIFNRVKNVKAHVVFQGKSKLLKNPECKAIFKTVKIFRSHSVSGARASCSKILNVKSIFNTVIIFRTHSFFMTSASCSKILNVKSIFNTVKNCRAHSVFQAKRKCAQKS